MNSHSRSPSLSSGDSESIDEEQGDTVDEEADEEDCTNRGFLLYLCVSDSWMNFRLGILRIYSVNTSKYVKTNYSIGKLSRLV